PHPRAVDQQTPHRFLILALCSGVAEPDRKALPALHGLRHGLAAERHLHGVLHVLDADAVAGGPVEVDRYLQIAFARDLRSDHVARAVDRFQGSFDFLAHAVDDVKIRPEYGDTHGGA